jgi:hypothetical protein
MEPDMAWTEQTGTRSWRVRYPIGIHLRIHHETSSRQLRQRHRSRPTPHTWLDPTRGRTTVADWAATWFAALDPRTIDNYRSILRCHILLRWGNTPC